MISSRQSAIRQVSHGTPPPFFSVLSSSFHLCISASHDIIYHFNSLPSSWAFSLHSTFQHSAQHIIMSQNMTNRFFLFLISDSKLVFSFTRLRTSALVFFICPFLHHSSNKFKQSQTLVMKRKISNGAPWQKLRICLKIGYKCRW